jgi:hypothetical protein
LIPWIVLAGAGGIFASVLWCRGSGPAAEPPRVLRERPPSASLPEDPAPAEGPARPVGRPATPPSERPAELAAPAQPARPVPQEFWGGLGPLLETRTSLGPDSVRQEVLARTSEYLGLDPSRAIVFQGVALQALTSIRDAWRARDEEVLGLPASLDDAERERREQEIQDRYEAAKRQASGRVESLLGTTARHEQFRLKLGEWIDAAR